MSSKKAKAQNTRTARPQLTSQNQPKPANKARTTIPPPQAERIRQRFIAGESIRKIARDENLDRATVTKVVRSEEIAEYTRNLKERFYGMGDAALDAVRRGFEEGDARLAYQFLKDLGVVPDREMSLAAQRQMQESAGTTEEEAVRREIEKLSFLTWNMAKTFNQQLPHVAKVESAQEEPLATEPSPPNTSVATPASGKISE